MEGDTEDAGAGEAAGEVAEGGNVRPFPRLNPHPRHSWIFSLSIFHFV